jgi:hypothetical protein
MIAGILVGVFGLMISIVIGLFILAATVFWIIMLIHALTNRSLTDVQKLIWVIVIFFLHGLGALIYFFVGRKQTA